MPPPCVVLVPYGGSIERRCEEGLQALEKRGYQVRRVPGFSAIDFGRSVLASAAVRDGFEELMWIDSDIGFNPDDVDKLRAHNLPIVCGIAPKKGPRQFACDFLPGTDQVKFGRIGGLTEIRYAGFGFVHTRRAVYETVRDKTPLAACNQRFNAPIVPFFQPMSVSDGDGEWYLAEDYAFCERVRRCGIPITADTSIRLWHVGPYTYGWEDAGRDVPRFHTYTFHLNAAKPTAIISPPPPPAGGEFTQDWFSSRIPLWEELLAPLKGNPLHALEIGVFEGRSTAWLMENVLTHPDACLTYIDTFAGGTDHAGMNLAGLEERFHANTAPFKDKLTGLKGRSQDRLNELPDGAFDLAYIDGSHEPLDVLVDAFLTWPRVKIGGLIGFDDYGWNQFPEPHRRPGPAIDAFLAATKNQHELLHKGYQVWVRKTK